MVKIVGNFYDVYISYSQIVCGIFNNIEQFLKELLAKLQNIDVKSSTSQNCVNRF